MDGRSSGAKAGKGYLKGLSLSLRLLHDYLKRAAYGPGATDRFTVCTPVALHRFNNRNNAVYYRQSIAATHVNAQAAPVTLPDIYNRHFNHVLQSLQQVF
jgi:hypothetical protein